MTDFVALFSAFGVGSLSAHFLQRHVTERKRRVELDKATYRHRDTVLVSNILPGLIHSHRCLGGQREQLAELVRNLGDRARRSPFLDRRVSSAWDAFLERSIECGSKRLSGTLTKGEIEDYERLRAAWERSARMSFGLPEPACRPTMNGEAESERVA